MAPTYTHDIIIIGGGAAGLSAASGCAQLGMKTALIEPHKTGGDCLYHGCVPSKTLIRSAAAVQAVRDWPHYGIHFPNLGAKELQHLERNNLGQADPKPINHRINQVIQTIEPHDSPERFRNLGAEVLLESAEFLDPHTIKTQSGQILSAKKLVLATGSRPKIPPIPGLQETGFITNLDVFSLETLPTSLVVLGAGPIGIELSQTMARLGVNVTLVEAANQILPREDRDMAAILQARLEKEGVRILTQVMATGASKEGSSKAVLLNNGQKIMAEEILVAVGRTGNIENLGLEKAGIKTDRGFFLVDNQLRTSQNHILAVGDCNGKFLFTPVAGAEGGLVVRKFALGLPGKMTYQAVPWVTYSEPELASVGVNETEAQGQNLSFKVLKVAMNTVDRALAEGEDQGIAKILIDDKDRVIGVQILGPHAGEMLLPGVFAVKEGWKVGRFLGPMVPYPTVSEVYKKAAGAYLGPKLFNPRVKKFLKFLYGFRG